jgi:hypothetical protein
MRNRLVLTAVLAMLVSGPLVTSVPAAPAGGASTLRPWGKGHTAPSRARQRGQPPPGRPGWC